jgi:hypothetical protein
MGVCYENLNNTNAAVQAYSAVVPLTPKEDLYRITAMSQLAAIYERQQAWNKALALYKDISKNAPKPEWREEATKRIRMLSQQ